MLGREYAELGGFLDQLRKWLTPSGEVMTPWGKKSWKDIMEGRARRKPLYPESPRKEIVPPFAIAPPPAPPSKVAPPIEETVTAYRTFLGLKLPVTGPRAWRRFLGIEKAVEKVPKPGFFERFAQKIFGV